VKLEERETASDADEDLEGLIATPQLGVSKTKKTSPGDSLPGSRSLLKFSRTPLPEFHDCSPRGKLL
jgi:hypothetical protein